MPNLLLCRRTNLGLLGFQACLMQCPRAWTCQHTSSCPPAQVCSGAEAFVSSQSECVYWAIQCNTVLGCISTRVSKSLSSGVHTGMSTRSLILGNVSLKPNRAAIEVAFGSYGLLEAVRTFPGKPYAIVHFHQAQHAAQAAASLDGIPVASISGKLHTAS